jgi:RHS repeat-associated protein
MKKFLYFTILSIAPFFTYGQLTSTKNHIYSVSYRTAVTDGTTVNDSLKKESIVYFDGLGRPIQSIIPNIGGNKEEIISHFEYDEFGRQTKSYLPYSTNLTNEKGYVSNAISNIAPYYQTKYPQDFLNGVNPYSEIITENAPNGKLLKQSAPGSDWKVLESGNDHTTKYDYRFNNSNDILHFDVEFTADDFLTPNIVFKGFYNQSELYVNIVKNENWIPSDGQLNTTETYTDKNGKTILVRTFEIVGGTQKTLNTYFVYDYFGNLTYTISPKASETFVVSIIGASYYNQNITYGQLVNNPLSGMVNNTAATISQSGTDQLVVNFNFALSKGKTIKTGVIATLLTTYPNMILGNITNGSYNFQVSINNNNLVITDLAGIPLPTLVTHVFTFTNTIPLGAYMAPIDTTVLKELCYQYKYDNKNRLVEKKIPGKDWEYFIYDKLNRPILSQDYTLRNAGNKWLFVKYDAYGRTIYNGEYVNSNSRNSIQTTVDNNPLTPLFETKTATASTLGGTSIYYTNNAFPNFASIVPLSIIYYDNYSFDTGGISVPTSTSYGSAITNQTKGLVTGSKIKVLETSSWITTCIAYDNEVRPIWTTSKNNYFGTTDVVETKLNFLGNPLENKTVHSRTGVVTNLTTYDYFSYDHADRLVKHTQKIGANAIELISFNKYDDMGKVVQQKTGGTPAATYLATNALQTIDYGFNVRGWLTSINDVNNLGSDLFAFDKRHNNPIDGTALYNGNISQTRWKTANDNQLRSYTYTYDKLERIKSAIFKNDSIAVENNKYNLKQVEYDANGNITYLNRSGWLIGGTYNDNMDDLTYHYTGNKLTKVKESSVGVLTDGFKTILPLSDNAPQYNYDDNGNITADRNKNIISITYNHFNLPKTITFGGTVTKKIEFIYTASGVKIEKKITNNTAINTTQYAGNYIYEKIGSIPTLKYMSHSQGYTAINGSTYKYVYQYKDHLGNVRLSYAKNASGALEIIEENNYFPFGMKHGGYNNVVSSSGNSIAQKFKFNGQETLDNFDLTITEMDFRQYDHALGRFFGIDALAESSVNLTPYHFTKNNPILGSDPSGLLTQYQNPNINSVPHTPYFAPNGGFMGFFGNTPDSFLDNVKNGYGLGGGMSGAGGAVGGYGAGTGYTNSAALGVDYNVALAGGQWITIGNYYDVSNGDPYLYISQNFEDGSIIDGFNGMSSGYENVVTALKYQIWNPYFGGIDSDDLTFVSNSLSVFGTYLGALKDRADWISQNYHTPYGTRSTSAKQIVESTRQNYSKLANNVNKFSKGVTYLSVGVTVLNIAVNKELKASDILSFMVTGLSAIPTGGWIFGGAYLVTDLIVTSASGKSLGQHLDDKFNGGVITKF